MARLFNDSQSEYLKVDQAAITAYPFVLHGWFYSDNLVDYQSIVWVGDKDVTNSQFFIGLAGGVANDPVRAFAYDSGGAYNNAYSSTSYLQNVWQACTGIFVSATDLRVFLDGGGKGTDNSGADSNPANNNSMGIGRNSDSSPSDYMSGRIAEAAIWDLTNWPGATASDKADEFERLALPALADRYSPLFFPLGRVDYWPLGGPYDANDGDHDIVGGYHMTDYNTPTTADHPPGMIYPAGVMSVKSGGAGPSNYLLPSLQAINLMGGKGLKHVGKQIA